MLTLVPAKPIGFFRLGAGRGHKITRNIAQNIFPAHTTWQQESVKRFPFSRISRLLAYSYLLGQKTNKKHKAAVFLGLFNYPEMLRSW